MAQRTVVVIGATGSQGGSVVAELLQHPDQYHVRALTRDPAKPAAQALIDRGVEVHRVDLDSGKGALMAAFDSAHVIYALTDFWQKQSATTEIEQGKSIAEAAAGIATLQHFDETGRYTLRFPHSPTTVLPNVAIADTGKLVHAIIQSGPAYYTKTIAFWAQALSEADKLAELGKCYNILTQYCPVSAREFQEILMSPDGMSTEIALDFTEQLMIFEECGNVYARDEFVQATEVQSSLPCPLKYPMV
ncbi:hypothetical protein Plec18167_002479 [Paecilomyces lecythidis]|uniref:NmrA-like domain-containing protein n=1 Tax=Paecilomyces lecythidis TaxID=3004212 RepID=A0ABR3Y6B2_9EURO